MTVASRVAPNWINVPARVRSKNVRWEFSSDKATQLLDAGGWKCGADGVRVKDGKRLPMLFQTATNAASQKIQAVIKQAAGKAGIEMELKSVVVSSFLSSDPANPDTFIPIVLRAEAVAISNRLRGIEYNSQEVDFWNLPFMVDRRGGAAANGEEVPVQAGSSLPISWCWPPPSV
jgi:ABC-type transport system substrate-binding protein